jgi:single-stranded-DNA-specific exonuclease
LFGAIPELDGWETLVAELLVRRGITDPLAARAFLDPNAYRPASPFELPGLDRTVERLAKAVKTGEQIAVWGDFDVDGQTATVLYYTAFQEMGARVRYTIPTRLQSHGVHPGGVQCLIEEGVQLIVTADTGVSAHPAIDLAARQGVDVLVTDHHDLPPSLPAACALVDPKLLQAGHPLRGLPGVGVAYQVVRGLEQMLGRYGLSEASLDLVALGIVADVALIEGDTRYLLQRGLDGLRRTERPGLLALMEAARLEPAYVDEEDIGFALAPRLNALSRVAQYPGAAPDAASALDATSGVELLTTKDEVRARTLAVAMEALNARRRWLTQQTFDAALAQLERDRQLLEQAPAIVVSGANWDPGIVGIVAGRLVDRYSRPAIVFSAPPGEIARGSARSIEGVDIHAAIAAASGEVKVHRYGGHPMAAGLSLDETAIGAFRRALWGAVARATPEPVEPELAIDGELSLAELSLGLVQAVNQLAPFGLGNEAPVFVARGLALASSRLIGRTRAHRRLIVRDEAGREQEVLWWYSAGQDLPEGAFDLAFRVGVNRFRGEERVQLTWVEARMLEAPAVHVEVKPPIAVRDYRRAASSSGAAQRSGLLASLVNQAQAPCVVWGEGPAADRPGAVQMRDRGSLQPAVTLIIWTAPPGVDEWEEALDTVAPREVVLVCLDPGMDVPRAFLRRLAALCKYALREYRGQTRLAALGAATAQTEWAVLLGLRWLAARGQIAFDTEGKLVLLHAPEGQAGDVDRKRLEEQLRSELLETAAYRTYLRTANADRLVNDTLTENE